MTCSFFGHAQITSKEGLTSLLEQTIERHILQFNVTDFLAGGMGQFDNMAARCARRVLARYPQAHLHLVIPYRTKQLQREKDFYASLYDDIIYPEEVWGAHPKYAITKRNRWMVQQSDYIIAYVDYTWGGAWAATNYAHRKKKPITNLGKIVYDDDGR